MTFFSSLSLTSSSTATPIIDAPLNNLPPKEAKAITDLETRLSSLFKSSSNSICGSSLHADDPWLSLPTMNRHYLLLRFARYHLLNVKNAEDHIRRVASWRSSSQPWTLGLEVVKQPQAGLPIHITSARGSDGEVLAYFPARVLVRAEVDHAVQQSAIEAFFEHCLYAQDGPQGASGVLIVDFANLAMKNVDIIAGRNGIRIFLECYPEAFKRIIIFNCPKWIHGFWKMLAPLLDARTVAKMAWLSSYQQVCDEVHKYFPAEQLPTWVGGRLQGDVIQLSSGQVLSWEETTLSMRHALQKS